MPIVKAKSLKVAKKQLKRKYGRDIILSKVHVVKSATAKIKDGSGMKWYGTIWSEARLKKSALQMPVSEYQCYSGKKFNLLEAFPTKALATRIAKTQRAKGDLARVAKAGNGWAVYCRKKR